MALWVLGAGLKVLFSRSTPVSVYVVVLMIEGIGIGFVLQPGKNHHMATILHPDSSP